MLLPVVYVDIRDSTDEEFQFSFVENIDKIRRNELVETGYECVELFFDALLNTPFRDESKMISNQPPRQLKGYLLDIFLLVLIRHFDVLASWL